MSTETHAPCPICRRQVPNENLDYHVSFAHRQGAKALPPPTPAQLVPPPRRLDPEDDIGCPRCGIALKAGLLEYHEGFAHREVLQPMGTGAGHAGVEGAAVGNQSNAGQVVTGVAFTLEALVKLGGGLLALLGLALLLWGGTNNAHGHCNAHRFAADNGLISTAACIVEH